MNKLNYEDRERVNALWVIEGIDAFNELGAMFMVDYLSGTYTNDIFKDKFMISAIEERSVGQEESQHKLDALIGQLVHIAGLTYFNWPEISHNVYESIDVLKVACDELNEEFLTWKVDGLLDGLGIKKQK